MAVIGSTAAARRAGTYPATSAITPSSTAALANTRRSDGEGGLARTSIELRTGQAIAIGVSSASGGIRFVRHQVHVRRTSTVGPRVKP